jgi:hypothetical protein
MIAKYERFIYTIITDCAAMGVFLAAGRDKGRSTEDAIDVSSRAAHPYRLFSPFTFSIDFRIPVPGQNAYACSVESIWQGLKIIEGVPDFTLFTLKPRKRKGGVEGHLYGTEILGCYDAREKIYKPSYFFYLENYIGEELKDSILEKALDRAVTFYDVEDNVHPKHTSKSLAHSAYLKQWFEGYLEAKLKQAAKALDSEYRKDELPLETVAEPVARAAETYRKSGSLAKKIIRHFLKNHPEVDEFHARFYEKLAEHIKAQKSFCAP